MEQQFLVMSLAVFGAAALQGATGIGFGVVAGPILLAMINGGEAIQISILMNLLIAAVLAPSLRRAVDWRLMKPLLAGTALGMPLGLYVFVTISIFSLKLLAALAIVLTMGFVLRNIYVGRNGNGAPAGGAAGQGHTPGVMSWPVGVVSGMMGGSLAMPGPVPAGWMSASGYGKVCVRATMLMLFVFSYVASLLLQVALVGIDGGTWWLGAKLAPATLLGVTAGRALTHYISERVFSWLVVVTLALTVVLLVISVV